MKLSVVIPTCNRPADLAACLERLAPKAQTLGADNYEVIVTDDGAPDAQVDTMLAERFPWARWVAGPRRGPAANRNHGARAAVGDVLVFFDDDCLPEAEVLAAYAAHFSAPGAAHAAEGRISPDRPPRRLDEEAPINEHGGCFWSCNIALRTALFRRLGGFDERFPHAAMEDVELRRRLTLADTKIAFLSDAAVVHPLRRMGGWAAVRHRAMAHGIYVRLTHSNLRPFSWNYVACRVARAWWRGILPELRRTRGRGCWRRVQYTFLPVWCAVEMRRASRLPRLATWTGDRQGAGENE